MRGMTRTQLQINTRTYTDPSWRKKNTGTSASRGQEGWGCRISKQHLMNLKSNKTNNLHFHTGYNRIYWSHQRHTKGPENTHLLCVFAYVIEKLKTNVLASELRSRCSPFKSSDICSIFHSGYLNAFSLFWPLQPSSAHHWSLCFRLIGAHRLQKPPSESLDLYDSSLLSIGWGGVWVCVPLRPDLALRASTASYQSMYLLLVFTSPRFPYSPLMQGQKKWVNNSTSSEF